MVESNSGAVATDDGRSVSLSMTKRNIELIVELLCIIFADVVTLVLQSLTKVVMQWMLLLLLLFV